MWRGWLRVSMVAACMVPIALAAPQGASRKAPPSFADLVDHLLPGVVNISTLREVEPPEPPDLSLPQGVPLDELFQEFLERRQRSQAAEAERAPRRALSLGSGFIIDPAGFIVTNDHVIGDAIKIRVTLHDDTTLDARLVGRDPRMDLALLKIEPVKPLPTVAWGRSDTTRVGDWVLTIGNPFGLGGSVTAGIVSARKRDLHAGPYDDFIQTDAAINSGNSGGPMFDLTGRVIGVDSAIYTPSGGNVGVGFAIPSSLAQPVIEQLRRTGHVRRGFLGVQLQSVTPELARTLTLDAPRGALVSEVAANGPAAAKLARGDVILAVAGQPVPTVHDLQRIVANLPIDQPANVLIWRDRREMPLEILIGQQPDEQRVVARPDASHAAEPAAAPSGSLGLTLALLTPELRRERALGKATQGVVVTKVQRDSPAEARGLHPDDVIVAIDGTRVTLPEDVTQHLQRAGAERRKSVLVLLERDGVQQFLALPAAAG